MEFEGRLPDALVACVGGGSNAMGLFYPFIDDTDVALYGVEAAGEGIASGRHAATLCTGPGVLHGNRTYLLETEDGQIIETHSISAGLDYPARRSDRSTPGSKDSARARLRLHHRPGGARGVSRTDTHRRHHLALESSHAIAYARKLAPELGRKKVIVVNLSGRGDKDITRSRTLKGSASDHGARIEQQFQTLKKRGRRALIPYVTAGDPEPWVTVPADARAGKGQRRHPETGVPFSDPMADEAGDPARLGAGAEERHPPAGRARHVREFRLKDDTTPVVLRAISTPSRSWAMNVSPAKPRDAGVDGVLTVDLPPEEAVAFAPVCASNLDPIFLIAPTSNAERVAAHRRSRQRLYLLCVAARCHRCRAHGSERSGSETQGYPPAPRLPLGVGFGISSPEMAATMARIADAVIVGSAIVKRIESLAGSPTHPSPRSGILARLREAMDVATVSTEQVSGGRA